MKVLLVVADPFETTTVTCQLGAGVAGEVQTTWLESAVLLGAPRAPPSVDQLNERASPCGSVALTLMATGLFPPTRSGD